MGQIERYGVRMCSIKIVGKVHVHIIRSFLFNKDYIQTLKNILQCMYLNKLRIFITNKNYANKHIQTHLILNLMLD